MKYLKIDHVSIDELKLYERNPRRITRAQLNKLMRNMRADPGYMECRPCLVNKLGNELLVYAGNQRVKAAKMLRWKKIPCYIEENLNETIMRKRLILDNRNNGEWDYDILSSDYEIPQLLELGFSKTELEIETSGGLNGEETIESEESFSKEHQKCERKDILCPNCGHVFEEV